MARSSARRRQARLAFTPLPSSSPASKGYNQQIRDRAAAVTVASVSSPAKKRKPRNHGDNITSSFLNEQGPVMATPDPSITRGAEPITDSDSEPIQSAQRRSHLSSRSRTKAHKRQQHIDFSKSRDPSSFDSPIRLPSSNIPTSSRTSIFQTSGQPRLVDDSSEESDNDHNLPSPSKLLAKPARTGLQPLIPIAEDSESEEIVVNKREASEQQAESDEEEEEEMPTTLGKRKRNRGQRHMSPDSIISSPPPPPPLSESDDDVVIVDRPTRLRNKTQRDRDSDGEDEDDTLPITPSRRKLKRRRHLTQQEKDDLNEDLDFLETSDIESTTRTPRDTQSVKKNARQKALEALRRKRNGNLQSVNEDVEILDEEESAMNRDDSDDGLGGDDNDVDDYDEGDNDDGSVQIMSSRQMFQEDEEDANFLTDEGDDAPLGVPDGMPIEFTQYASMKPKELFKYAIEWMVQKKINPAYEGNDELYQLAFKKLDDEVRALAGSKFTSSAWTSKFTLALQARPELSCEALDRTSAEHFFRDKCDACNRSSHPATFEIQFHGSPYHHDLLEEVNNEDEDSDSQDSEANSSTSSKKAEKDSKPAYDEQGREIAPASMRFFVGKFCMANARTAHSLSHWRYHLNEWVMTWLIRFGYCAPDKVVERDGWKTSKRGRYANKIVDRMASEGTIKELWRSFRDSTDAARNSKQGRFGSVSLD